MKRLLAALALLTICAPSMAQLTPYSYLFYQADSVGWSYVGHLPTPASPTGNYLFAHDGSTTTVGLITLGSGLSLSSGSLVLTAGSPVNADWNASSGLAQILNKPAARSQASASRSLNSAFQISTTRDTLATYSVQITVTASIAGGQNGDVILEIASNSGFTTDVQTLSISGLGQTYTLAVALQGVQPQTAVVSGYVPAGFYARLRTVNNTGTPGFSFRAGQEVFL